MLKMLNFRCDRRTLFNVLKFPVIVCVRVPVGLFFRGIEWIDSYSDLVMEYMPGWDPGNSREY